MSRTESQKKRSSERKAVAQAYVAEVRRRTFCSTCGSQPIDWHSDTHLEKKNNRVSNLAKNGYPIARIQAEIDICEPLCRSCHVRVDGRAEMLASYSRNRPVAPPKPCRICGRLRKPLRKGRCGACRCYWHCHGTERPIDGPRNSELAAQLAADERDAAERYGNGEQS